jgi:hypothetical protein
MCEFLRLCSAYPANTLFNFPLYLADNLYVNRGIIPLGDLLIREIFNGLAYPLLLSDFETISEEKWN